MQKLGRFATYWKWQRKELEEMDMEQIDSWYEILKMSIEE